MKRPRLKKTLLPAALALALIVPAAAYAAEQTKPGAEAGPAAKRAIEAKHKHEAFAKRIDDFRDRGQNPFQGKLSHKMAANQVNQHKYLELLAEKYSPATLADWKSVLTEQQNLHEQLQALLKDQGVQDALKAQKKQLQEQWKTKQDELKQKVESGAITKEQVRNQLKSRAVPFAASKDGFKNALPKEAVAAAKDAMKHRQDLTEAVKADDADAIRAALAPILEDLKKGNEKAAAQIAKLKPNANGQAVQPRTPKHKQDKNRTPAQTQPQIDARAGQ
jgi:hypothetical protein